MANNSKDQGFASMDDNQQRDIASLGGQQSSGSFKNDKAKASSAGRKGGSKSRRSTT